MVLVERWKADLKKHCWEKSTNWFKHLGLVEEAKSMAALLKLAMANFKKVASLFWQLALIVAELFDEAARWRLANDGQNMSRGGLVVVETDRVANQNAHQIEAFLGRRMVSAHRFFQGSAPVKFFHMATDKSHVGGLPLQATFLGVGGSNTIVHCLPRVGFSGRGGGRRHVDRTCF